MEENKYKPNKAKAEAQDFVAAMEELLDRCIAERRLVGDNNIGLGKLEKKEDFKDHPNFNYYRGIQGGRAGLPERTEIMVMADFLNCTLQERNNLLNSANYHEVQEYLKDEELQKALEPAKRILDYLPNPAFVVTRDETVHDINELGANLFGISRTALLETPEDMRNVIRYIFDPFTQAYPRLNNWGRDAAGYEQWRYTARLNILRFKTNNILCKNDDWYKKRIDGLRRYPEFEKIWKEIDTGTGVDVLKKHLPFEDLTYPEYVTVLFTPDGRKVRIRGLQIDYTGRGFPQILAYIPDDLETRTIFTELKIPTPDNAWGYST